MGVFSVILLAVIAVAVNAQSYRNPIRPKSGGIIGRGSNQHLDRHYYSTCDDCGPYETCRREGPGQYWCESDNRRPSNRGSSQYGSDLLRRIGGSRNRGSGSDYASGRGNGFDRRDRQRGQNDYRPTGQNDYVPASQRVRGNSYNQGSGRISKCANYVYPDYCERQLNKGLDAYITYKYYYNSHTRRCVEFVSSKVSPKCTPHNNAFDSRAECNAYCDTY